MSLRFPRAPFPPPPPFTARVFWQTGVTFQEPVRLIRSLPLPHPVGFVHVAPLPARSIPAPASIHCAGFLANGGYVPRAGSIDSVAPLPSPCGLRPCRSASRALHSRPRLHSLRGFSGKRGLRSTSRFD